MTRIKADLIRNPGSVLVGVRTPNTVLPVPIERHHSNWAGVAQGIATQPPPHPSPATSEPRQRVTPQEDISESLVAHPRKELSINEVFAESLPLFVEASRWGRYICLGPASRIFDNSVLIYHTPSTNFWDLYELAKGVFRDLGIRVSKRGATWEAHIPISVLTDKVFIESGLAAVEKTLLAHTGIDPVAILNGIRERQFRETQEGIKSVKRMRSNEVGEQRSSTQPTGCEDTSLSDLCETVGDAVGVLAIVALSWATYLVL